VEILGKDLFMALEFVESEDRDHNFTKKVQIVLAIVLQVEVFAKSISTAIIKACIS
jgi:hypothetical protein